MIKWKVCGMREKRNITEILALSPDYMGFIFFEKSARFVQDLSWFEEIHWGSTKKVGVFVNQTPDFIKVKVNRFKLDVIQLHGEEDLVTIQKVKELGVEVIKMIPIDQNHTFENIKQYQGFIDFLLFDTFSNQHGGTGKKFNWEFLKGYSYEIPFFLSGGIGLEDVKTIKEIDNPQLVSIDINSRFEISPGIKQFSLIKPFIEKLYE